METTHNVLEEYMTAPQAAQYLGLTRNRVGRLCIDGRFIGAVKIGRNWIIPRKAVESHERLKPGGLSHQEDQATIEQLKAEIAKLKGAAANGD